MALEEEILTQESRINRQCRQQGGNWPLEPEEVSPKPVLPSLPRRGSGWKLPPFTLVPSFLGPMTAEALVHTAETLTEDEIRCFQQCAQPAQEAIPWGTPSSPRTGSCILGACHW